MAVRFCLKDLEPKIYIKIRNMVIEEAIYGVRNQSLQEKLHLSTTTGLNVFF